ncbi:MAG: NUDIX domain-containing protein, partial [Usitatibacter sp.]
AEAGASPREFLAREWGLEAARVDALEPFEHAFTHYTLDVEPWRVELARAARIAEGKAATWIALDDLAGAALPAPVRRLLEKRA